jgi:hypothetical protein
MIDEPRKPFCTTGYEKRRISGDGAYPAFVPMRTGFRWNASRNEAGEFGCLAVRDCRRISSSHRREAAVTLRVGITDRHSREIDMKTHGFGRHSVLAIVAIAGLMLAPIARTEPVSPSPASLVPTQLLSARKAFLSNAGLDGSSIVALNTFAKAKNDIPYADFVSAMKSWGQYDCVAAPADSDVVFEFRVESALSSLIGSFASYSTYLSVVILDTKTHFVLWTVKVPLDVNKKFDQNVGTSVANLLDSIKSLTAGGGVAAK